MTKTPEQEANELVEMFKSNRVEIFTRMDSIPCVLSDFLTTKSAKELAALHVERLMIYVLGHYLTDSSYFHYQQVLQILKDKK